MVMKKIFAPSVFLAKHGARILFPETFGLGKTNAKLMGRWERKKLLHSSNTGLVLDGIGEKLSDDNSFRNVAMVASTGWGKTSGYIIPNILHQNNASMVITDPSGALFRQTSGALQKKGYSIRVLNPLDLNSSIRFNPFSNLRNYAEVDEVSQILVETANPNAKDPFWNHGAQTIISILARTLRRHPKGYKYANLANILHLLNNFEDGTPLNPFISKYADAQTYSQYKGFISNSSNTLQGLLSTAKISLKAIADPDIAKLTAYSSFSFEELREKKVALFLIFPQNRLAYYSFLMNVFYTKLFHYCLDDSKYKPNSRPIYFLLDEFGHLTIPNFSSIITTTRQRRISISIILQSISQLEAKYGKNDAHTILNGGVASRIFSPGLDTPTNQMLSQTLGTKRQEIYTSEDQVQVRDDPILEAYQIRTMQDNEALFLFANKKPIKLKITRYFENREMLQQTQLTPAELPAHQGYPLEFIPIRKSTSHSTPQKKHITK